MNDFKVLTQNTTTAFLVGVAVIQLVAALKTDKTEANALGAGICTIAAIHYLWMQKASPRLRTELRFGDWICTVPLLVAELFLMTRHSGGTTELLLLVSLSLLMIVLGYIAARQASGALRYIPFFISTMALMYLVYAFVQGATAHRELLALFFGLWALYPIAFLATSDIGYDLLDLASKGLFGIYVAHLSF